MEIHIDVGHAEFNRGRPSPVASPIMHPGSAIEVGLDTTAPASARRTSPPFVPTRSIASRILPDAVSLDDITIASEHMAFASRQILYRQGDPSTDVFILIDGTARLTYLLSDGRQASVGLRFDGDVLGFTSGPMHHIGAEALTAVSACRISRRELERQFRQHPRLERHFIDLCARELATTQSHLVALGRFTAEERVAAFLISLADAQDRRGHHGPIYDVPVTRADVGELLGLTLETVSRAVSAFRRRGWLRAQGLHEVEFLDRDALAAVAAGEGAIAR